MGDKSENTKNPEIAKRLADQENTIATLKNELNKTKDPNAGPRVIKKGNQKSVRYIRNNDKINATIPKEDSSKKPKKK